MNGEAGMTKLYRRIIWKLHDRKLRVLICWLYALAMIALAVYISIVGTGSPLPAVAGLQ
jgi:hypothetical protein